MPTFQTRLQKLNKILSLKGVDPKLAQVIIDEIVDGGPSVTFEDIGVWHYKCSVVIYANNTLKLSFSVMC